MEPGASPEPARVPAPGDALPPIAGTIKRTPADFVVRELPLYAPSGTGQHVWLTLRRTGLSTDEVVTLLARLFGVPPRTIGVAGRKDKHAVATQAVSLELADDPELVARRVTEELPLEVLAATRHGNKLRRGHLVGNRFELVVRDVDPRLLAYGLLERRVAILARDGFANRFGPQRFGRDGANAERGRALLRSPRRRRAHDDLMLSAWQSALFERWIDARLALGPIGRPLAGDLLRVEGSGGLFASEDHDAELARAARGEITPTGPLFGARMRRPSGPADELERALLAAEGVGEHQLAAARLPGARRPARVLAEDLAASPGPGTLRLAFTLAKGAYATVLVEALLGSVHDASADRRDV